jgi:hypothetical protein
MVEINNKTVPKEFENNTIRTNKIQFQGITYIVESVHKKTATETAYDKVKRLISQHMNDSQFE